MIGIWAALLPHKTSTESCTAIDLPSLAVWALQFSPRVAVREEVVLVEVGASARLFGGLSHLRGRIESEASELGVEAFAWAPTGTAALALVRSRVVDGFAGPLPSILDKLPLETNTAVARHQGTLHRLGSRTLGDVRKLRGVRALVPGAAAPTRVLVAATAAYLLLPLLAVPRR